MGVHLTLTSEWTDYRWRPLSTADPASGLLDDEGYFPALAAPVQANADEATVRAELVAQIERALAAGIDVTHVDSHMLTLFHPRLARVYIDVACQFNVPPLLVRIPDSWLTGMGYSAAEIDAGEQITRRRGRGRAAGVRLPGCAVAGRAREPHRRDRCAVG